MKKIILVFAAIAITAGAYAQADSTNTKLNQHDMNNSKNQNMQTYSAHDLHPDGVLMKNGKVMVVKNGERTTLDQDMTMSNGTKVKADGNYTQKDGTTMKLKEGEHMDMEGNMNTMDSYKDKNMDFNQDLENNPVDKSSTDDVMMKDGKIKEAKNRTMTTSDHGMTMDMGTKTMRDENRFEKDSTKMRMNDGQHRDMSGNMNHMKADRDKNMDFNQNLQNNRVDKSCPDGVMMKDGKIMKVKDGKTTTLDQDMTMSNGTKIMADGTWTKKDGTKMMMKDGEHIDMDGNLISMEAKKDKNMYLVPDSTRKQDY